MKSAIRRPERPIILALRGDLGSGKTTFVQGLASALGIREKVQSPTFVLMKWYQPAKRFRPLRHLIHIDAYRLKNIGEARHLGLKQIFSERDAVVVIEWADRIVKLLPEKTTWIKFRHTGGNHRLVTLK